jgi:lysophospholipase L1-like esterase
MAYNPNYPADDAPIALGPQIIRQKGEELADERIVDAGFLGGHPASDFILKTDATDTNVKIIPFGDSVTAGYPYTDNCPNEATDTSSWTAYVRNKLQVTVLNKGIGGQTTAELLARFDADVVANNPTHCIIMAGINDAYKPEQGITLAQSEANFDLLITRCNDNNIIPIVGIFMPTDLYTFGNSQANQMCDSIRTYQINYCTTNNIAMIDFYNMFYRNNGLTVITSLFTEDILHPNLNGYIRMGEEAVKALRRIIPKFQGNTSLLEDWMNHARGDEAPKKSYKKGDFMFTQSPDIGSAAGWIAYNDGTSPTWYGFGQLYASDDPGRTPRVYLDDWYSPNLTRFYYFGDFIVYNTGPLGHAVYISATTGYHAQSSNNPKATWVLLSNVT